MDGVYKGVRSAIFLRPGRNHQRGEAGGPRRRRSAAEADWDFRGIGMKIIGQYDTEGNYRPYAAAVEVSRLGGALRDKEYGFVLAVKDGYGDWVSPTMLRLGLKSRIRTDARDEGD